MPCVTGRSNHVLLKKNCVAGCGCCVNTAYSCAPPCFKYQLINFDKPNVSDRVCGDILWLIENDGCLAALNIVNLVTGQTYPAKYCRFELTVENETLAESFTQTFEDRTLIDTVGVISSLNNDDVVNYYINGTLCATCTISS